MNSSLILSKRFFIINILLAILILKSTAVNADWTQYGTLGSRINAMIKKDNFIFAGTGMTGIYRSSNNGNNWTQVNAGLPVLSVTSFTSNSMGIFASTVGGIYLSTNNGDLWTQAGSGSMSGNIVSLTSNGNDIYAGHILAGVFESTNNGSNWTRFALGEGDKMNTILCTGPEFFISIVNTVFRSTNGGKTWKAAVNGLMNNNVELLSHNGNDLYAGTKSGVFYSGNSGELWTLASNGLANTLVTSLASINNGVFAGTFQNGIFKSSNNGLQWTNVNEGLTDSGFSFLLAADQYLFAGSANGNIWRRDISEMITDINLQLTGVAVSYKLHQNYPNPFNPVTKINFEMPEANYVTLNIYDTSGSIVNTIFKGQLSQGSYSLNYDASYLSSGIYFYEMKSGKFVMTKKMVIAK